MKQHPYDRRLVDEENKGSIINERMFRDMMLVVAQITGHALRIAVAGRTISGLLQTLRGHSTGNYAHCRLQERDNGVPPAWLCQQACLIGSGDRSSIPRSATHCTQDYGSSASDDEHLHEDGQRPRVPRSAIAHRVDILVPPRKPSVSLLNSWCGRLDIVTSSHGSHLWCTVEIVRRKCKRQQKDSLKWDASLLWKSSLLTRHADGVSREHLPQNGMRGQLVTKRVRTE
ncbi:hypothetical protein IEO21_08838 [Rhodonia placenta]|uniref:Uncharacterized protein n=1 Tax=Rhodonia placenta TaxID=104341 RepID=A0A8H7NVH8_9APHY|nr:hypothetical protein IEO21_08838 [Postia placenta]